MTATLFEAGAPASGRRAWAAAGVGAALVAGGLAAVGARRSLTLAEVETVLRASRNWRDLVPFVHGDPSGSAHAALLHGWLRIGSGEWMTRAPSMAAAALTALAVYALGARLLGRSAGALAALLFATSAAAIGAGRSAAPVATAVLASTVATWLLVVALDSGRASVWAVYALVAAASAYVQAACVLVLPAHAAAIAFGPRRGWPRKIAALTTAAAAALPVAAAVAAHPRRLIDRLAQPSLGDVAHAVHEAGGRNVVLLALAAGGAVALALRLGPAAATWTLPLLVTWAAAPLAAVLVLSIARPSLDPRYLAVSMPALALLAAAGAAALRRPELVAAVAVAAIALGVVRVAQLERSTAEDWRAAVTEAFAARAAGERVVVAPARALSAFARYAGPGRGSLSAAGPSVLVLVRARDPSEALRLARVAVRTPAYALRDARRLDGRLWLERWERTGLPPGDEGG